MAYNYKFYKKSDKKKNFVLQKMQKGGTLNR